MTNAELMTAILDSMKDPVLFADTDHMIRYMNKTAATYYKEGTALLGTSLMDCHNAESQKIMIEVLAALENGEDERMITDTEKHRIYMRAVRDGNGRVIGYYERYEPPDARAK